MQSAPAWQQQQPKLKPQRQPFAPEQSTRGSVYDDNDQNFDNVLRSGSIHQPPRTNQTRSWPGNQRGALRHTLLRPHACASMPTTDGPKGSLSQRLNMFLAGSSLLAAFAEQSGQSKMCLYCRCRYMSPDMAKQVHGACEDRRVKRERTKTANCKRVDEM